jgi:hemolysin activation/secretion protein
MHGLITISRAARRAALVITLLAGAACCPAARASDLTTRAGAPAVPTPVVLAPATPIAAMLTTVIVNGASAYAPPRLYAAYRDALGRPASRDAARAIASAVTELYAADGFVRPEIAVDDSLAGRGVLRLAVHEARVTRVVVEGPGGRYGAELRRIAARLEAAQPLRRDDIPRTLREMRALSGLAVTASTRRDAALRNAYELAVHADFSPLEGVVRINNRGTDQVGPGFMLGQLFANGLLGRQEKIGLIFAAALNHDEYLGGGLFAEAALGGRGTRGSVLLFRSRSAPNEAPVNLDHRYVRERAVLRVTRALRPEGAFTLGLGAALEADELDIRRDGDAIREDRLRIVETGLRASYRAAGGAQLSGHLLVRKGLDALGGGLSAHGLASDARRGDFLLTQLQATAYRRVAARWTLHCDAFAQHSGYVLPDSERFKIGGDRLGRGFEVAEIAGDRGIGGKLELRRDLTDTGGFAGRISSYGFYDVGAAWKQDRPGRESAATAGLGIALTGAALTGYLEVAAPLTGPDIEGRRAASVFAELSWRF